MEYHNDLNLWFLNLLLGWGVPSEVAHFVNVLMLLAILVIIVWGVAWVSNKVLISVSSRVAARTSTHFDDHLLKNKTATIFSRVIPYLIVVEALPIIFNHFPRGLELLTKATDIYIIVWFVRLLRSILHSLRDYLKTKSEYKDKPIDSFIQVVIIVANIVAGIMIFSTVTGKSAGAFLTAMGAASAILLLIFKDTILGFVASIQVSVNDMVRIGDWITMEKYGADGDVVEINLTTVKVQNFDKTITTIPTYYLISDSFKNWRGMQQSGGRRIKRAIRVKVSSIRFLTNEDLDKFRRIQLVTEYIDHKKAELTTYNAEKNVDLSLHINGRHLTNIGLYRKYISSYIEYNDKLHKGMTMMVRQLEPTINGLPIELYVFTNDIRWQNYEGIMADLFDHLLAAATYFDLEVYEMPTSSDVRHLVNTHQ